jgi:serine phosphatase RsbU (regulator of sigma subunit)
LVRAGTVVALLAVVTAVQLMVDDPGLGVTFYALIPIVLAAFWFKRAGALLTGVVATVVDLGSALIRPSAMPGGDGLWVAAANRSVIYVGVALIVTSLLCRERELRTRVARQREQLDELESLRAALTPADVGFWPGLELATCYLPTEGVVAGDFFLVTRGPAGSTTIVIGDVMGHGLQAARQAAYVRAALSTFAVFTADPVQLLQLANTALRERAEQRSKFVTVTCMNIAATDGSLTWACAGHPAPWRLDNGDVLKGGRPGMPLGLSESVDAEAGSCRSVPDGGVLLFTDGLIEARAAVRDLAAPRALFGERRVREALAAYRNASPQEVVRALSTSVSDFAGSPLADDLCILAFRAVPDRGSAINGDSGLDAVAGLPEAAGGYG